MASATPEQAQAGMQAWMSWAANTGDAIVGTSRSAATDAGRLLDEAFGQEQG